MLTGTDKDYNFSPLFREIERTIFGIRVHWSFWKNGKEIKGSSKSWEDALMDAIKKGYRK